MDDEDFSCSEQALQFSKAKRHRDRGRARKILASRDVLEIKRLGDEITTSKEWDFDKEKINFKCQKCKFDQNPALKKKLIKTEGLELAEATHNNFWATGYRLGAKELKNGEWKVKGGKNKHGEGLMKLRQYYKDTDKSE